MKRLAICCDGTWNTPDRNEDDVPLATNVVKIAEAVPRVDANGTEQRLYYDPGVGTAGTRFQRIRDGATGRGLARNLTEAYKFIVENYEPGDELFLFGFSRGAFTVRSLAGMLRKCGVLRLKYVDLVERAFGLYRARGDASHPRGREATLFRRTYAVLESTPIRFVGVWDTVGSLGNPLLRSKLFQRRTRFHDLELSSTIEHAYQALAVDEKRRHFRAALWTQNPEAREKQVLQQMWFVGVHSDVGGGNQSCGLSDISLEWMAAKAISCGLALEPISTVPVPNTAIEESWRGFYSILKPLYRPIDRPEDEGSETNESLHPTVMERYRTDPSYRPKNLLGYLARGRTHL